MKKNVTLLAVLAVAVAGWSNAGDGGVVRIANRDSLTHSVAIDAEQRILQIFHDEEAVPGAAAVPAGGVATTELMPGQWLVYGDGEYRFTIMIARNGDYDFTLQPFSQTNPYGGTSHGLLGLIDDGYHQSSYQLFALDDAPPPVVAVQPAPSEPAVVVVPSPSYYYPPPPPPPHRRDPGRELGEAIGTAVFDILGSVLSDDHHRRGRDHDRRPPHRRR